MRVLWEILETAVNLYQGFLFVFFTYSYLGDKQNRKFYKSPGIIYSNVFAAAIYIYNRLTFIEHL